MKSKINNSDAPKLIKYDPIEHREGSLFLWDAALNPTLSLERGAVLSNLLSEFSAAAGNEFEYTTASASTAPDPTYIKTELTAKKGIHFIVSQSATTNKSSASDAFFLQPKTAFSQAILDKLDASPNMFVSVWTEHTRYVTKSDGTAGLIVFTANNTTNLVGVLNQAETVFKGLAVDTPTVLNTSSKLNLTSKQAAIVGAPNNYQFTMNGYRGTKPSLSQTFKIGSGIVPPYSGSISANQAINAGPSFIVYRIYIEDLKLSGRTFAEVKAIDDAEHAKAFAAGGRFYGDTWSNPATILP